MATNEIAEEVRKHKMAIIWMFVMLLAWRCGESVAEAQMNRRGAAAPEVTK